MIVFFCGTPGSGKSYEAVKKVIDNLRIGRVVCTNIDGMDDPQCQEYMKNLLGWDDYVFSQKFRFLTQKEIMNFWKTEKVPIQMTAEDVDNPAWVSDVDKLICPHNALIIIDEVHKHYNSRDWQAQASRELGDWASTHRHYGYDLIFITQKIDKVDKQVRTLAEWTYFFRKVNFLGSLVSKRYIKYSYSGDEHEGKALAQNVQTYKPEIFKCYKSYTTADAKEVGFMSHINILKHPIFFAIPVVFGLCLYMIFGKSSIASGDLFGINKVKKIHEKEIAALKVAPVKILPISSNNVAMKNISSTRVSSVVAGAALPGLPEYGQYMVSGWYEDQGRMVILVNGQIVKLPSPAVKSFRRGQKVIMGRIDFFGAPEQVRVAALVPEPVKVESKVIPDKLQVIIPVNPVTKKQDELPVTNLRIMRGGVIRVTGS
jgi:zona occludens toxin (predicted ATPase)